jgi:hypothetical protein
MVVRNLVDDFITLVQHRHNWTEYENTFPQLFEHYFRYWCPPSRRLDTYDASELELRSTRVLNSLRRVEARFARQGFDLSELEAALFVGGNTSNGHAFLSDEKCIVWFPVETYTSDLLADIFVAHEICHSLHYLAMPDFCFVDELTRDHVGRQLITEGLATFLTAELIGVPDKEALWADYLSDSQYETWLQQCNRRLAELCSFCRDHFHDSVPSLGLFVLDDFNDVSRCRAGYLIGMRAVRSVAERQRLTVPDLLELSRQHFEQLVFEELSRMI